MNDEKWMDVALEQAETALGNGEFPVGCVLVSGDTVVGSGARKCSTGDDTNELDHAEITAIRDWIKRGRQKGEDGITAYVTLEPCLMCLGALIINGIDRIVFAYEDVMGGACGADFTRPLTYCSTNIRSKDRAEHLYLKYAGNRGGAEIIGGFMRERSLMLFYDFFANDANGYLKDTYLARYTLEQGKRK